MIFIHFLKNLFKRKERFYICHGKKVIPKWRDYDGKTLILDDYNLARVFWLKAISHNNFIGMGHCRSYELCYLYASESRKEIVLARLKRELEKLEESGRQIRYDKTIARCKLSIRLIETNSIPPIKIYEIDYSNRQVDILCDMHDY